MKKLSIILSFLLSAVICYSQPVVQRAGPANTVNDPRGMNSLNHFIPRYLDTTTANISSNLGIDSAGAIIYTYDVKQMWVRQHSPKKWVPIGQKFGETDIIASGNRAFDLNSNTFTVSNGKWKYNTSSTNYLAIGSNVGTETGALYTPDGTVLKLETRNSASLDILSGSSISIHPSSGGGQLVIDGTTSNYFSQIGYTGGAGLLFRNGIGVYSAPNNESEWYFKTYNYYDPVLLDSQFTYLTLYNKMKFINIPNDDTTSKIITIDGANNVRYRNVSSISGGGGSGIHSVNSTNPFGMIQINDSTTRVDSFIYSTRAWRQKSTDSLVGLIATKQPTGNYITALTGDVTASGPGSAAATLATVNSNVGSFTNANITVNAKGLITAASNGSGGGGTPAGNTHDVQLNRSGSFYGSDSLLFNASGLTIIPSIRLPNSTTTQAAIYLNSVPFFTNYSTDATNVGLGKSSGSLSTSASNKNNIGIGNQALVQAKSASNIAIGLLAGNAFTASADSANDNKNIFIGDQAGSLATGGVNGIYIGTEAGKNVQNGSFSNAAVGKVALANCTTCNANAVFGPSIELTTGVWNALVGADIGINATSASYNGGVGAYGLNANTTGSYNAFVGYVAGGNNTTGSYNTYLGEHSGQANQTGTYNIFLGRYAGAYLTSGDYRFILHAGNNGGTTVATAVGDLLNKNFGVHVREDSATLLQATLQVNGTAMVKQVDSLNTPQNMVYVTQEGLLKKAAVPSSSGNITVGTTTITSGVTGRIAYNGAGVYQEDDSLKWDAAANILTINAITVGRGKAGEVQSVELGNGALGATTTGTINTAIGYRAMFVATTGGSNTSIGSESLLALTSGSANTAIGNNALKTVISGSNNVAVGTGALQVNTASSSTAVGVTSFQLAGAGGFNTGVGFASGSTCSTCTLTTIVGYNAGNDVTTGNDNTFVGAITGDGITTGSNNTIIGAQVTGLSSSLASNIILAIGTGAIKAQFDGTDWTTQGKLTSTGSSITSGVAGTTKGSLILAGNTAQTVTIQPLATAGNYTLTLPSTDGNNLEFLQTDGSGNLTWAAASGAVTSITGTANQVLANGNSGTSETGAVTLTLPQSIATSSNVQFGTIGIGGSNGGPAYASQIIPTANPAVNSSSAVLNIQGTINENSSGTHVVLAGLQLLAPTITAGAATVTRATTLYIGGPTSATVTEANYPMYISSGTSYLGDKINIASGSNKATGTATLSSGTVTVSNTLVTASSLIFVTYDTPSGTLAAGLSTPSGSIVAGTSFVINSLTTAGVVNTLDNSTIKWWLVN